MDTLETPNDAPLLVTEVQAARMLGLSIKTLRKYRAIGRGPRFVKFGRAVRYRIADLEEYIRRNTVATSMQLFAGLCH